MQFQGRVLQFSRERERRADAADDNFLRLRTGDDETTDKSVIAGLDAQARRNISEGRGCRCRRLPIGRPIEAGREGDLSQITAVRFDQENGLLAGGSYPFVRSKGD